MASKVLLKDIERLLCNGKVEEARNALLNYVQKDKNNAYAWYILGGIYRRFQMWGDAINAYNRAKMIEPEGPADAAIESIYDVIRFTNKDLMNP